jgi:tellurite resistance protein TehA-like permease
MPWNEALLDVNAYMHACTYVCFYVCVFVYFALVVLWVQHIVKHMPP